MEDLKEKHDKATCSGLLLPVMDSLEVLSGKWKLTIIASLMFESKRFKQIVHEISGLTDKSLSKELKDLEANHLIKRTVYDTFPPTVEYEITEHGKSLKTVIEALRDWGLTHRKEIIGK